MLIVRWTVASVLAAFFILNAISNWNVLVRYLLKNESGSTMPLVGGVASTLAIFIAPSVTLHRFWCVPLVLDYGCAPGVVYAVLHFSVRALRGHFFKKELVKRELPPEVIAGINKILPSVFVHRAQEMLAQTIPHLHLDDRPRECTRVLLAAIRRSNGDIARLEDSMRIAKRDWKFLLVSAGLDQDDWEKILKAEGFAVPSA